MIRVAPKIRTAHARVRLVMFDSQGHGPMAGPGVYPLPYPDIDSMPIRAGEAMILDLPDGGLDGLRESSGSRGGNEAGRSHLAHPLASASPLAWAASKGPRDGGGRR